MRGGLPSRARTMLVVGPPGISSRSTVAAAWRGSAAGPGRGAAGLGAGPLEATRASAETAVAIAEAAAEGSGALTRTDALAGGSFDGADELGARAPSAQASVRTVVSRRELCVRCISRWSRGRMGV